jgi:hypothetical protein
MGAINAYFLPQLLFLYHKKKCISCNTQFAENPQNKIISELIHTSTTLTYPFSVVLSNSTYPQLKRMRKKTFQEKNPLKC